MKGRHDLPVAVALILDKTLLFPLLRPLLPLTAPAGLYQENADVNVCLCLAGNDQVMATKGIGEYQKLGSLCHLLA